MKAACLLTDSIYFAVSDSGGLGVGTGTLGLGSGTGVGASCGGLSASDVLASDPRAGLSPDSADSWLVLRVVGV